MDFDEMIDNLAHQGSNTELLEGLESNKDLRPQISEGEVKDTHIKEEDDVTEEEESLWHENTAGDSEDNLIEVNSEGLNGKSNQGVGNGVWYAYGSEPRKDNPDPLDEFDKRTKWGSRWGAKKGPNFENNPKEEPEKDPEEYLEEELEEEEVMK